MKISETCMKFREESDFDHPRLPKMDPGQIYNIANIRGPWGLRVCGTDETAGTQSGAQGIVGGFAWWVPMGS